MALIATVLYTDTTSSKAATCDGLQSTSRVHSQTMNLHTDATRRTHLYVNIACSRVCTDTSSWSGGDPECTHSVKRCVSKPAMLSSVLLRWDTCSGTAAGSASCGRCAAERGRPEGAARTLRPAWLKPLARRGAWSGRTAYAFIEWRLMEGERETAMQVRGVLNRHASLHAITLAE